MAHRFSSTRDWSPSDIGSHGWHAGDSGLIPVDFDSLARGGSKRPGGGGGGGGTPSGSTYVSGDPLVANSAEFNIEIIFKGTWTTALKNAFIVSAEALSDYILGDLSNVLYQGRVIDDISITAELLSIDGAGGILGQAGPTAIRTGSYLPATAVMQFDSADATYYDGLGLFNDIALHEMMHCVGVGTIWNYKGLLNGNGTSSPTFNGAFANDVYPGDALIPVENSGGGGTAYSHWEESVFGNELMTGYINNDNTLFYMTIASLGDLGYSTVSGASYVPPTFI